MDKLKDLREILTNQQNLAKESIELNKEIDNFSLNMHQLNVSINENEAKLLDIFLDLTKNIFTIFFGGLITVLSIPTFPNQTWVSNTIITIVIVSGVSFAVLAKKRHSKSVLLRDYLKNYKSQQSRKIETFGKRAQLLDAQTDMWDEKYKEVNPNLN